MKNSQTLKKVLDKIKNSKTLPVVVFDLDDTLFSTAKRNLTIIQNFASFYGDLYPDFAKVTASLTLLDMNWDVSVPLKKVGLDIKGKSYEAFHVYWGNTFFTNEYCAIDLPNPGAVKFATECHNEGAQVYYLTGRHAGDRGLNDGMGQGTTLALYNREFPFWRGRCELNLKQNKATKDEVYKAKAIKDIKSLRGEVIATFDNEPHNCVMFLEHFPDSMNFWVKTTWNPQDNPDKKSMEGLIEIPNFLY